MNVSDKLGERPWPRLEIPRWVPPAVADEARFLYDSATGRHQTVERHIYEEQQAVASESKGVESRGVWEKTTANSRFQAVRRSIEERQKHLARTLRSMTFEQIELLCRIASDERMENVWHELYRRTRGGERLLNPAKGRSQDVAATEFFYNAFSHAAWPIPLLTYDDFELKQQSHINIAARLREEGYKLSSLGSNQLALDVEAVAANCEACASLITPIHPPTVTRSRGDPVLRGYILRMTIVCEILFGKELHGTVATAAAVAFSKKISGSQVRDMVRANNSQARV